MRPVPMLMALLIACSGSSPARAEVPAAPTAGLAGDPVVRVLGNGMRIVVESDPVAPVVQTQLTYHVGSRDELPGKTGLAHALEHMMFRGTKSMSYAGLEYYLARIGARFDAHTDSDETRFDFTVPKDRLGSILRIEADRMVDLALDPEQWKLERGAVLSELENDYDNPLYSFDADVNAVAFAGTPYQHLAIGSRAEVEAATVDDLRALYERYYTPKNATLVIVGDVSPDDAFAAADAAFGAIPNRSDAVRAQVSVPAVPSAPVVIARKENFPFTVVDLVYRTVGGADPASYDIQNFAFSIEDPRSAFYEKLITSGLALFGSVEPTEHDKAGALEALYVVAPGHTADEVRAAFEAELAIERGTGPSPELVASTSAKLLSADAFERESLESLGSALGTGDELGISPGEDDALTAAVSPASIAAALQKYAVRPVVVGTVEPRSSTSKAVDPPASLSGAADDNFGGRVPDGPVVLPPDLAREPSVGAVSSTILPERFTVAGMHVLVLPSHFSRSFIIRGEIETSPAADPPGKTGLGAIAGDVMDYGNASEDFETVQRRLGELGASLQVGSSFGAHGRSGDFDAVAALLAHGLEHPAYPPTYLALTLAQFGQVSARRNDVPGFRAKQLLATLLDAPNDPSLRLPTPAGLASITRDDVVRFAARNFRPELATVVVTGDVEAGHVRDVFERLFADWKGAGPVPHVALPSYPAAHAVRRRLQRPGDAVDATLVVPAVSRQSRDFEDLTVATAILGGAFDARLMNEIRQKRGLAYDVGVDFDADRDRGAVTFHLKADPKKAGPAVAILRQQLRLLGETPPTPFEVSGAERLMESKFFVDEDSLDAVTSDVLDIGVYGLPVDYASNPTGRFAHVTPASVSAAARRYLNPDALIEVDEGP